MKIEDIIANYPVTCGYPVFSIEKASSSGTMVDYVTDEASSSNSFSLNGHLLNENELTMRINAENTYYKMEVTQTTIKWRTCEGKSASFTNANFSGLS